MSERGGATCWRPCSDVGRLLCCSCVSLSPPMLKLSVCADTAARFPRRFSKALTCTWSPERRWPWWARAAVAKAPSSVCWKSTTRPTPAGFWWVAAVGWRVGCPRAVHPVAAARTLTLLSSHVPQIDDMDIRQVEDNHYRQHVAIVSQQVWCC